MCICQSNDKMKSNNSRNSNDTTKNLKATFQNTDYQSPPKTYAEPVFQSNQKHICQIKAHL